MLQKLFDCRFALIFMDISLDYTPVARSPQTTSARMVCIDCEIGVKTNKLIDFGAIDSQGNRLHSSIPEEIRSICADARFLCGHNIAAHDIKYVASILPSGTRYKLIDTLALSALLFPQKRFHALLKDEKLLSTELNNPLTDAIKARDLFELEIAAFAELPDSIKAILASLLKHDPHFAGFFEYIRQASVPGNFPTLIQSIRKVFEGKICSHADLFNLAVNYPVELGFVLAFIAAENKAELLPAWTVRNFPKTETVFTALRDAHCAQGCAWCYETFKAVYGLKTFFGFEAFRTYNGEPLQERAAQAALDGESLLAIFPTGGGKSITFQIPALMQAKATRSLTVVLSPLQSLMKDQVDHLTEAGIEGAYTINGMLSPIERARAFEAIYDGSATLLYISPEQLRSKSIENALMVRRIARFVIDEAHCFSAWGHDFRVDYLYIGDFIAHLQELQGNVRKIPVSCFTATAKQKVVTDICDYFRQKLGLELKLFTTQATRENLHYQVIHTENNGEKYQYIRSLIASKNCPSIVYVSSTTLTEELAKHLSSDGFKALPFHGKMESSLKVENQEAFLAGDVNIMVATNAFGMGVDKKDVGLVIHYDISSSLENYVQEAGRAGRDPSLEADCYILFNESDLDNHFVMLSQSKLSIADIQMVWKGIKNLTKSQMTIAASALEIAREAGWNLENADIETRIKTALAALESANYIQRGRNVPRVFASSIAVDNFEQAKARIVDNPLFENDGDRQNALRIIRSLISERATADGRNAEAESRVDYLADRLGISLSQVIGTITRLRIVGLLNDEADMSASFGKGSTVLKSLLNKAKTSIEIEKFLLDHIDKQADLFDFNLKGFNTRAQEEGLSQCNVKLLTALLRALKRSKYLEKVHLIPNTATVQIRKSETFVNALKNMECKAALCEFVIEKLYADFFNQTVSETISDTNIVARTNKDNSPSKVQPNITPAFSTVGLLKAWQRDLFRDQAYRSIQIRDIEELLLWMNDVGILRLQGGFMVLYQGLTIKRLIQNRRQYRKEDYKKLGNYYQQKMQQIHIVGEYANLMMRDYAKAQQYVHDYFALDYEVFLKTYFAGDKLKELEHSMTPQLYAKLFKGLSSTQLEIVNDKSQFIVVSAGPGSGKTRTLVHKLASLLTLEDVRAEQLLMLTFSRAAATEFKKRLIDLIGKKAYYVDIKTFHSYAFDVLGELGSLDNTTDVVKRATQMINDGNVVSGRIAKTTLVIDEAQDMDADEYELVRSLIEYNETLRVIAVGDDDQNIYAFRGSDSRYMSSFVTQYDAVHYEMTENWRSCPEIVALANRFVGTIHSRLKHNPGVSTRDDEGFVKIVTHSTDNFEVGIVSDLLEARDSGKLKGTTAVLTCTNEEAYRIASLLNDKRIRAQLIQGQREVALYNFVEVRTLLNRLNKEVGDCAMILPEVWDSMKTYFKEKFASSHWSTNILHLINNFENICPKDKIYKSDFEEFIKESSIEDTYTTQTGTVTVSTMHKAKGKEFDNVFILASRNRYRTDDERRTLYVGLTRAKNRLSIHTRGDIFGKKELTEAHYEADHTIYPRPDEITLYLTHQDVWLGWQTNFKKEIFALTCSQPLILSPNGLATVIDGRETKFLRYSKSFEAQLEKWAQNGYQPIEACINYILAWKNNEDEKEYPIVLPKLRLKKATASIDR